MLLKHQLLSLCLFCIFFLSDSFAIKTQSNPNSATDIFSKAFSFCTPIHGEASLRDAPKGYMIRKLEEGYPVIIKSVYKDWVEVTYSIDVLNMELCNKFMHLDRYEKKTGFVHIKFLPKLAIMNHNSMPDNNIISVQKTTDKADIKFRDEVIHSINLGEYGPDYLTSEIDYYLMYTGVKEYPYLFFYSGWGSDINFDPPVIVLFGNKTITHWYPQPGNRTSCKFLEIKDNELVISEALLCGWRMTTQIKISSKGILRTKAVGNRSYLDISNQIDLNILKSDINIFNDTQVRKFETITEGTIIKGYHLIRFDEVSGLVEVELNDIIGWIKLDDLLKSLPLVEMNAGCIAG